MITQRILCGATELAEGAIQFTTSAAGNNINFFEKASTTLTPTTDYIVSINDVETQQAYNSLTFSQGDVVKITAKAGVKRYPQFSASLDRTSVV